MCMAREFQGTIIVPLMLACSGLCCGVWVRKNREWRDDYGFKSLYFVLPVISLVYCWILAPNPRFFGAAFWMFGMGAVTWALVGLERKDAAICAVFISTLLFGHQIVLPEFVMPWTRDSGPARTVNVVERETSSGLKVYIAPLGEDGRSWDSPLPSAAWFDPNLAARVPGNMSKGCKIK